MLAVRARGYRVSPTTVRRAVRAGGRAWWVGGALWLQRSRSEVKGLGRWRGKAHEGPSAERILHGRLEVSWPSSAATRLNPLAPPKTMSDVSGPDANLTPLPITCTSCPDRSSASICTSGNNQTTGKLNHHVYPPNIPCHPPPLVPPPAACRSPSHLLRRRHRTHPPRPRHRLPRRPSHDAPQPNPLQR